MTELNGTATSAISDHERMWNVLVGYCLRDWRVHLRSPLVIGGTLAGPLLLLLAIGIGLGSAIGARTEHQILTVIVPGLAAMGVVLVCSQRSITVFTDRATGLTDEILAGPVNASTIVFAQTISSTVIAMLQALAVYGISAILGLAVMPAHRVAFIASLFAFAFACAASCSAMGLLARRPGSIQALLNLVVNPLFFLSGALFDVDTTATPMRVVALLNPFHYGVYLLQSAYSAHGIGLWQSGQSVAVLVVIAVAAIVAGTRSLRRT